MNRPPYPKAKLSGVEWLGDVPALSEAGGFSACCWWLREATPADWQHSVAMMLECVALALFSDARE